MSNVAPEDGGSNPANLKDKLKHPFEHMREKFQDSKLYDVKVSLSHKKCANPFCIQWTLLIEQTRDWKAGKPGKPCVLFMFSTPANRPSSTQTTGMTKRTRRPLMRKGHGSPKAIGFNPLPPSGLVIMSSGMSTDKITTGYVTAVP